MIVRLLIWSLYDSKTTIDELRESLPELVDPSTWIWNESNDRFGVVVFGEDVPESVGWATRPDRRRTGGLRGVRRTVGLPDPPFDPCASLTPP